MVSHAKSASRKLKPDATTSLLYREASVVTATSRPEQLFQLSDLQSMSPKLKAKSAIGKLSQAPPQAPMARPAPTLTRLAFSARRDFESRKKNKKNPKQCKPIVCLEVCKGRLCFLDMKFRRAPSGCSFKILSERLSRVQHINND